LKEFIEDGFLWKNLFMLQSKFKIRAPLSNQQSKRNWKQIFIKKTKEDKLNRLRAALTKSPLEHFSSSLKTKKCITASEKFYHFHCDPLSDDTIVGTFGNSVKLWDLSSGIVLKTFQCHTEPVRCVYYDEFILVSGSMDKTIKITDMDTEINLCTLTGHTGWVLALKYDLLHLVSGSSDKTIKFWDFHSGACLSTLSGHTEAVRCVELKDGVILSGSADSTVKTWDIQTQTCTATLKGHSNAVSCCQFGSNEKSTCWTGSFDSSMILWDLRANMCARKYFSNKSVNVNCPILCLQADEPKVICGAWDGFVKIIDSRSDVGILRSIHAHKEAINCIQLFQDERVVTGSYDWSIKIWQPTSLNNTPQEKHSHSSPQSISSGRPKVQTDNNSNGQITEQLQSNDRKYCAIS